MVVTVEELNLMQLLVCWYTFKKYQRESGGRGERRGTERDKQGQKKRKRLLKGDGC